MNEKKNPSFRDVLVEFMGYTTGHGFGRLVAATTFVWRIFWTLAILCAFGMFSLEVRNLFTLYLSRPVQTSVTVTFEKKLNFPAVTICNLNIMKRSSMMLMPEDFKDTFKFKYTYYNHTTVEAKKNTIANGTKTSQALGSTEEPKQDVSATKNANVVVSSTETTTKVITTNAKPKEVVSSSETPTKADGTKETTQADTTTKKANVVVKSTETPTEVITTNAKPNGVVSSSKTPTNKADGTKEATQADTTTKKGNVVGKSTETPTEVITTNAKPNGIVSSTETPTKADSTEETTQADSTTKKANVVVSSAETPSEVITTNAKPNEVVSSTETPTKADSTEGPKQVESTTEKANVAITSTETPTDTKMVTGLSTTEKATTDLGTKSKPKRRKRDVKKEEPNTDYKESDVNTNTGTSDGKSDTETSDGKSDTETSDGKSDTETSDGKSGTGTSDGKSDTGTSDGKSDTGTSDGKSDTGTSDGKSDTGTFDGKFDTGTDDKKDYYDDFKKDETYKDISDEYPKEEKLDKETKLRMKVESYIGGKSPEFLTGFSHQLTDLIKKCTWKGVDCIEGNSSTFWKWSWNYKYGNCYTFNDGVDDNKNPVRILKSSKPGPSQGLILQLAIEEGEYIGELTNEAGVRVLLHEPGSMPFLFEEGFSVSPGMATSVGLTKTIIKRLDRFKNGSCVEDGVPLREDNLYRKHKNITRYSLQACLNSCLGESQLNMCQCAEASYPSGKKDPCDVFDADKRKCLQVVKFLFNKDELSCISECKRPCKEQIYEKTISLSQWPSSASSAYWATLDAAAPNRSNALMLNIFYSQLNYQVIEETFSYTTTNLLADIGGQLGLWIGISALTCGEVLELIFQFLVLVYKKITNRRQNRVIQFGETTG